MAKLIKGDSWESDCLYGETDGLEGPRWLGYDYCTITLDENGDIDAANTWVSTQDQDGGEGPQYSYDDLNPRMQGIIHLAVDARERKMRKKQQEEKAQDVDFRKDELAERRALADELNKERGE